MQYKKLGKTGMDAGIIGLGAEHLDGKDYSAVKETFDAAMEYGINMVDIFMPGSDIRQKIGKAIKGNRNKFIIQGHIAGKVLGRYPRDTWYLASKMPGHMMNYRNGKLEFQGYMAG